MHMNQRWVGRSIQFVNRDTEKDDEQKRFGKHGGSETGAASQRRDGRDRDRRLKV
jgi:hypothetical protein